jgi:hypothetical protein
LLRPGDKRSAPSQTLAGKANHSWRGNRERRIIIWLFNAHERASMTTDAGLRLSRFSRQKQRARRVRIGVVLVLCALPVALALAKAGVTTLAQNVPL